MTLRYPLAPVLSFVVLLHVAFFSFIVFVWQGTPEQYRIEFSFLGDILSKQDLLPRQGLTETESFLRMATPMTHFGAGRPRVWDGGPLVEKPEAARQAGESLLPDGYATPRVDPEESTGDVPGIPSAQQGPLRMRSGDPVKP